MRKVFAAVEANFLQEMMREVGIIRAPEREEQAQREGPAAVAQRAQRNALRPVREQDDNSIHCTLQVFLTRVAAEEWIAERARRDRNGQWLILESVALMEIPPVEPIVKTWNDAGEMV